MCAVCLLGVDNACVLDRASSTVMMIIGVVMLIPVAVALYTAWVDHRNSHVDERTRLLYVFVRIASACTTFELLIRALCVTDCV